MRICDPGVVFKTLLPNLMFRLMQMGLIALGPSHSLSLHKPMNCRLLGFYTMDLAYKLVTTIADIVSSHKLLYMIYLLNICISRQHWNLLINFDHQIYTNPNKCRILWAMCHTRIRYVSNRVFVLKRYLKIISVGMQFLKQCMHTLYSFPHVFWAQFKNNN